MKGRRVPVVYMPPRASDRSQDVDFTFFSRNPDVREYTRDLIRGESPLPWPPGTKVVVRRVGQYERWRGFVPPPSEVN